MTLANCSLSDIGECLIGIHNCSQLCMEQDGGYECRCHDGYELGADKVTCRGAANNLASNFLAINCVSAVHI